MYAMQETALLAHHLARMGQISLEVLLEVFVGIDVEPWGVSLELDRCDCEVSVLATPLDCCEPIRRQIAVRGLEHCRARVRVEKVGHLRQFQLPNCSSRVEGCALSPLQLLFFNKIAPEMEKTSS